MRMRYDHHAACMRRTEKEKPILVLRVVRIEHGHRQCIRERRRCFVECDPMLRKVAAGFPWIVSCNGLFGGASPASLKGDLLEGHVEVAAGGRRVLIALRHDGESINHGSCLELGAQAGIRRARARHRHQ